MNQKSRQEAPNKIEGDFFKLLNNANFGCDCRKNLDNCTFNPINDEINELSFIRRYYKNLFDKDIEPFINARILQQEIDEKFNNERQKIKESDRFFGAKIRSLENRKNAENEAVERFREREKKHHKKAGLSPFSDRIDNAIKNQKVKTIINFSDQDTVSIKALGVKTNEKVKITTRFIKEKMLIFCFPDSEVQELYAKHDILKCFIYLILTDTDSCSLQFLFLTCLKSQISEDQTRKLIFEIILLKIGHRLDTSDKFYEQFLCRNEKTKKQVGLYEVESVDNANLITIAVNPKEYYEIFRNKSIKKT